MLYHRFLVRADDHFNPDNFPQVEAELDSISAEIASIPPDHKIEMLLSAMKGEAIQPQDSVSNPALTQLLRKEILPISSIEALFTSCAHNKFFSKQFEEHIKYRLMG